MSRLAARPDANKGGGCSLGGVHTTDEAAIEHALDEERAFVHTLGGYTVEIAGARLVTHERIAVPRFNFVQDVRVAPERQSGLFERALDHYFQRALRPEIRVRTPAPPHVDRSLRSLGFAPRPELHELLLSVGGNAPAAPGAPHVREAQAADLDTVVDFWVAIRERDEFRRSIETSWERPNPDEELTPLLAERDGRPVAAALVHTHRGLAGIHAVATQPAARGRGAATSLVAHALARTVPAGRPVAMHAETDRLARHLRGMGFQTARAYRVYELPAEAELAIPPAAPPAPPRWRPPRRVGTRDDR